MGYKNTSYSRIGRYLMFIGLFSICCSNEIFLNHTEVTHATNFILSNGFSFSFRACSEGIVLKQGDIDVLISIEKPLISYHKTLTVFWKSQDSSNSLIRNHSMNLTPEYSLDSNILVTLRHTTNSSGSTWSLIPDHEQSNLAKLQTVEMFVPDKFLSNSSGNLTFGSTEFYGCIVKVNGRNVGKSDCPLANLAPCNGKYAKKCPAGFTGRYCHINIDDCSSGPCQQSSSCIDLVDDYECQCGKRYAGKNCERYLGSPCNDSVCNNGTCRLLDNGNDFVCDCKIGFTGQYCESMQPCDQSPCFNNATCENTNSIPRGYRCKCAQGFTGIDCNININDCANGKCSPGTCLDGINSYTCNCTGSGFSGNDCKININECEENKNLCNNGTCKDLVDALKYKCNCYPGFTGRHCTEDVNECQDGNLCKNGECVNLEFDYRCNCDPGYKGKNCDQDVDECEFGYCRNSKSCSNLNDDYECICNKGYTGKNCTEDINECSDIKPCQNGATCENTNGSYVCKCQAGYEGFNCSDDINECKSMPCLHNGTCLNLLANYSCTCKAGYTGKSCETNIDDCASNPCQNYGTCSDKVNNYTCLCIPSWTGPNCTTYQDPCSTLHPCLNNGTCYNHTTKGYDCNCTQDYGGQNCEHRIGKCFPQDPCVQGQCLDEENYTNYTCNCTSGYKGRNCSTDVNECVDNPNPCVKGKCVNTIGSFSCDCEGAWLRKDCSEDKDECEVDKPCQNNSTCRNYPGSFECNCVGNYVGKTCETYHSACAQYLGEHNTPYCSNSGRCEDFRDRFTIKKRCDCRGTGFNGTQCEVPIDDCFDNTCVHGTCHDLVNDFNCTCDPGYSGKNCSEDINDCSPDPCKNGECVDLVNNYRCNCSVGYNGSKCENDIDWCNGVTCQHGGTCVDDIETYNCSCLPGFTGRNCETDIDECELNPCRYNSSLDIVENTCIQRSNLTAMRNYNKTVVDSNSFRDRDGYECVCEQGLSGVNCQTNAPDCNDTFCRNNGTCVDRINNYTCNCIPGWTGSHCEVDIDECAGPNPCQNNGTCLNLLNRFECNCTANYTGNNCETQINYCSINTPCQNGATCTVMGETDYNCTCRPGFTGKDCGELTTINFSGKGYWRIPMSPTKGDFEISLWFRTTLDSGVLLVLNAGRDVSVYLSQGTVVINIVDSFPFIDDSVDYTDGTWHQLRILYQNNTLFRAMDNSTLIESNTTINTVNSLFVGGIDMEVGHPDFTGCVRDLRITGQTLSPVVNGTFKNINVGSCERLQECTKDTCNGHGDCVDSWISVSCKCARQYYGTHCQSEMQSFNFQPVNPTNLTRKRRASQPEPYASSNVSYEFDGTIGFSFLLRTRQGNSFIALLLSKKPASNSNAVEYLLVELQNGALHVSSFNQDGTIMNTLPTRVDNGQWMEIRITKNSIIVNGSSASKSLHPLNIHHVFMGGVDNPPLYSSILSQPGFEGCLQAVKLGDAYLTNQLIPNATSNHVTLPGVQMDVCKGEDVCGRSPCLFNGTCVDTWNDFMCECHEKFQGKTCADYGCRINDTCSSNFACLDVPNQPGTTRCSSILTYNGFNSSSTVSIGSVANDSLSFALRTRQENTLILMAGDPTSSYFKATIENGNLTFTANYGSAVNSVNDIVFTGGKINTGTMHAISLLKENNSVSLLIDNIKLTKVSMLFQGFAGILGNSNVSVGKHISDDRLFQGCFGGLNIGGTDIDLKTSSVNMDTLDNCTSSIDSCKPSPCQNDSKCSDDFNDFKCECPAFYTKKTCNETNNVNCAFMPNLCVKGACKNNTFDDPLTRVFSQNGADLFTCECDDGFIGVRCENVTNECEPIPCVNNSTCTDLHLGYNCTCPEGYSGTRCEFLNVELCNTVKPCLNGALCSANVTGYTCECPTDYTGKNCSVSSKSTDDDDDNLPYIIGFSVLAVVILIIIIAVLVARYCRDKSGMEGTYSPNKEEQTAGNVEMGTVKKPKTERLI